MMALGLVGVVLSALFMLNIPIFNVVTRDSSESQRSPTHKQSQHATPTRSDAAAAAESAPALRTVVVVGGGLAGLTAAVEAHQQAAQQGLPLKVVLLEKMPKVGGNSAKASSGMNALNVPGGDSLELFTSDTLTSGGGLSSEELVAHLVVGPGTQDAVAVPRCSGHCRRDDAVVHPLNQPPEPQRGSMLHASLLLAGGKPGSSVFLEGHWR